MNYRSSLTMLLGLVDFERFRGPRGPRVKFDLSRMAALLERLDNPHLATPTVHVAGTKGKGSVAAMITAVLTAQGYRTGTFTSPHLHYFRERIGVGGEPVSEETFAALAEEVLPHVTSVSDDGSHGPVTLFETLTAMAFVHFRRIGAHFQVMETGLGGRLDSTNLVRPQVCVITSVSLDHTAILGDTVELIAREKAGIVKRGATVVTSPQRPGAMAEIRRACKSKDAPLWEVGRDLTWQRHGGDVTGQSFTVSGRLGEYRLRTPLLGDHQLENAAASVGALEALIERGSAIDPAAIEEGFRAVRWPCRFEVLQHDPVVVADGAHNPHSMARLCETVRQCFPDRRAVVIFGASRDKNLAEMTAELARLRPVVVVTRSRHPRAAAPPELVRGFAMKGMETHQAFGAAGAVEKAKLLAGPEGVVIATGSLFLAAEAREVVLGLEPEIYMEIDMSSSVMEPVDRAV